MNIGIKKLYYSIKEVSNMTGVKQYVLRYWETEFPSLKPAKNRSGNRTYTSADIKTINRIKTLLYDEKFTVQGARKKLKESDLPEIDPVENEKPDARDSGLARLIKEIRTEIEGALKDLK